MQFQVSGPPYKYALKFHAVKVMFNVSLNIEEVSLTLARLQIYPQGNFSVDLI